jgi:hypothetical protein
MGSIVKVIPFCSKPGSLFLHQMAVVVGERKAGCGECVGCHRQGERRPGNEGQASWPAGAAMQAMLPTSRPRCGHPPVV